MLAPDDDLLLIVDLIDDLFEWLSLEGRIELVAGGGGAGLIGQKVAQLEVADRQHTEGQQLAGDDSQ